MKRKIFLADLTHTAQGLSASTFPLGVSFVASYAKHHLGEAFEFQLFKLPSELEEALRTESPIMLCLSNYSWNFELAYKIATLAKGRSGNLVTVFGGPNFPTVDEERRKFLRNRPSIDFYIQLEGEVGLVDLVHRLDEYGFDAARLRSNHEKVRNTAYVDGDALVSGPVERIKDINIIPSPYLTGMLDRFFQWPLSPMLETTRGCPFSCTFCADGLASKSKVVRFDPERIREELHYIAARKGNVDELIITDLNFAMYKEDLVTAASIREVQEKYNWPILLSASAGKNKPTRTIEVATILKGSWTLGASIQSTDPDVLKAIKRSNISSDAYKELIDFGNNLKTSKTHSEIILGLPEDSKERHFTSLRFGVDNRVNSLRMFQAMLLSGTDMATQETRRKYGLVTKFRTIPGCVGIYEFFGAEHPVSEIEEIIVGTATLPFEDYVECRVMNLLVETFYNNALFEEVFSMVHAVGGSIFDCLLYMKAHTELYSDRVREIIQEFENQTTQDLFDTFEEAESFVLTPENIEKYIGGELGINELLVHRALLYTEFEDSTSLVIGAVKGSLASHGLLTSEIEDYLRELGRFTLARKKNAITATDFEVTDEFEYDFLEISRANYLVNPNNLIRSSTLSTLRFFHTPHQRQHIANQLVLYANSPIGLGRFIQRSNMKLVYRSFEEIGIPQAAHISTGV